VKRCWRPIRCAPGQPVAGCLAIVIDRIGLPGKGGRSSRQFVLMTALVPDAVSPIAPI